MTDLLDALRELRDHADDLYQVIEDEELDEETRQQQVKILDGLMADLDAATGMLTPVD